MAPDEVHCDRVGPGDERAIGGLAPVEHSQAFHKQPVADAEGHGIGAQLDVGRHMAANQHLDQRHGDGNRANQQQPDEKHDG